MTALLVPVQLDALVVRDASEPWAMTRLLDPQPKSSGAKRQDLTPPPFQQLDPGRPTGAYLHWALPDGLTRARPDPVTGKHAFPPVPDRWLVVRLSGAVAPGTPRTLRTFLLPDVNAATPVVLDPLAGDPLPAPGTAPERPLTAAGHGDLSWAGYFDNVLDRLALYDALTDAPAGQPVAYLVCGWYTDPTLDPVVASSASDSAAKLADLRWQFDQSTLPTGVDRPDASVYFGMAVSIGWPQPNWTGDGGLLGAEPDARPAAEAVSAAIGETEAEALAALTAADPSATGAVRLLEGLFSGSLDLLDRPDGPARLDTDLHIRRFGSRPSAHEQEWIYQPGSDGTAGADGSTTAPASPAQPGTAAAGDLSAALAASQAVSAAADTTGSDDGNLDDSGFRQVLRTRPRVWHALDPDIVLSGAGRSFRHGGDGRFTSSGELACRIEGNTVTAFGVDQGDPGAGAAVLPAAPLSGLDAYGLPAVCAALVVELASLDPGSSPDLAQATATAPSPVAAARAKWWTLRDPNVTPGAALDGSHVEGVLPTPLAVTPPGRPWIPLHLEWSASYAPSPRGSYDWQLLDTDFALPDDVQVPPTNPAYPLSGRVLLSAAPATVLAAAAAAVEQRAAGDDGGVALLADAAAATGGGGVASTLSTSDLLSGSFATLTAQLRKDPAATVVRPVGSDSDTTDPSMGSRPAGFLALRAGFLQLDRLRLVDGFGRYIDLLPGPLALQGSPGVQVPGHDDVVALKPRFTAPAQVLLRYTAASGSKVEADSAVSPVCGYVVPSPLDGTLEFFDDTGGRLGRLRPDDLTGTAWEEDPGQAASYGARPSHWIPNAFLGRFADTLLATDVSAAAAGPVDQTALAALVHVMDATRWTVDVTGRAGDEHLSLLLGSPVAVMRATILLDVQDPRNPAENLRTAVPVKLGTLAHEQDGLLAYVVDDDFSRVRVVDPTVAGETILGSARSRFVDDSDVFYIYPGTPVSLLLFMVPQADVHATTGLLPQKPVGMLREWTAPALAQLSPAFRYGPVLRDPKKARLPVPSDVRGIWTWHHRPDPTSWANDELVTATADSVLGNDPMVVNEGWLSVTLIPDNLYRNTAVQVQLTHIRTRALRHGKQLLGVGGTNPDGSHFLIPVEQAARLQESGRFAFFIERPGAQRRDVHVITMKSGKKYLRTPHDKVAPNNLQALPEAPESW